MMARRWVLKKGRNTKRGLVRLIVGGRLLLRLGGEDAEREVVFCFGFWGAVDFVFIYWCWLNLVMGWVVVCYSLY